MTAALTPEAEQSVSNIAARYGLSTDAVVAMLYAVNSGGGTMAQFSIPELGGSGQWMRGGMTMVGNMFDNNLKARVDNLCNELSQLLATTIVFPPAPAGVGGSQIGGFTAGNWWPADLGVPSSTGAQNGARYAVFPATARLAVESGGVTRVYDTGQHQIGGVQQQHGGLAGTVSFTSQFGTFDTTSLIELTGGQVAATPVAAPAPEPYVEPIAEPVPSAPGGPGGSDDIFAAIESLAGLHQRGILTDEEFATKKAELLGRL
ncbi:SHOCT domain-containing protein [Gordonia sp. (in: high G+C Gram-positive bacteria)]|mgnify:CR=1 FL=1|uniref:SHOCT domain-containing protein n=1 Tax=Gordonia sp. (in: high G+C Gram-positive bacteria) TaxID=84139 RepID=UPI002632F2C7|nr:SHOCT domain-containing protein [Gordonia sp. (in: high G+C Gram-positive bacteria)]HMS74696.1 SHOCT domain-containing protein [Gordonia sp. (in: high G+C Gram-positive bacteria)]